MNMNGLNQKDKENLISDLKKALQADNNLVSADSDDPNSFKININLPKPVEPKKDD